MQHNVAGIKGNTFNGLGMPMQHGETVPSGDIPDAHRFVRTCAGHALAVGIEDDGRDHFLMPSENMATVRDTLGVVNFPQADHSLAITKVVVSLTSFSNENRSL